MEQLEQAERFEAMHREQCIQDALKGLSTGESRTHCEECEEPIPEARRQAVRGCIYCRECAEIIEKGRAWRR